MKMRAQRVAFHRHLAQGSRMAPAKSCRLAARKFNEDAAGNTWLPCEAHPKKRCSSAPHRFRSQRRLLDGCSTSWLAWKFCDASIPQYHGKPPVTGACGLGDEEAPRFGKSLFGSSACSGNLRHERSARPRDKAGIKLPDALKNVGIDFEPRERQRCGTQKRRRLFGI